MPSPFKRHSASRQIQPMSAAELQASLEETEAQAAEDTAPAMGHSLTVKQLPNGKYTLASEYHIEPERRDEKKDEPVYLTNWKGEIIEYDTADDAIAAMWPKGLSEGPVTKQRR